MDHDKRIYIISLGINSNRIPITVYLTNENYMQTIFLKTTVRICDSRFGLVSMFNGISTFVGYLMPKPFS